MEISEGEKEKQALFTLFSLLCDSGLPRQEFSVDVFTGFLCQLSVSGSFHVTGPITTVLSPVSLSTDIHVKDQQTH